MTEHNGTRESRLAVIGDPVQHSRSPHIYSLLARSCGLRSCSYDKISPPPGRLEETTRQLFRAGGLGFNVTSPFKQRILSACRYLTPLCFIIGGVNTVRFHPAGYLLGTNTDGAGLLDELGRLNLLRGRTRVLLVGAGSTARSAAYSLLTRTRSHVTVTNRTVARAEELVCTFRHLGDLHLASPGELEVSYDLILNTTSAGMEGQVPILPPKVIGHRTCCYDVCYPKVNQTGTPFTDWCYRHGAISCFSGVGMLVAQARRSFQFWHGILPPVTDSMLEILAEATLARPG